MLSVDTKEACAQSRVQDLFHEGTVFCHWGIIDKRGTEYLIITKKRAVLASATDAPHESFFHQGHIPPLI